MSIVYVSELCYYNIIIKSVFSVALPTKKHLSDEPGRVRAPRGAAKIIDFGGGDKRAILNCKTQFYSWLFYKEHIEVFKREYEFL